MNEDPPEPPLFIRLMIERDWSKERLAREADVSSRTLKRLQKRETKHPDIDKLRRVAAALEKPAHEVFPEFITEADDPPLDEVLAREILESLDRTAQLLEALIQKTLTPTEAAELMQAIAERSARRAQSDASHQPPPDSGEA